MKRDAGIFSKKETDFGQFAEFFGRKNNKCGKKRKD